MSAMGTVDQRPTEDRTQRRKGWRKKGTNPEEKTKLLSSKRADPGAVAAKQPISSEGTEKQSKGTGSSGSGGCSENEEAQGLLTACEPEYEARLTYEQMMMRYGNWKSIRRNVFGYVLIILFSTFTKSFVDLVTMTSKIGTIVDGWPALACCCNLSRVPEKTAADEIIANYSTTSLLSYTSVGIAILGPWIEIYIGRRKTLLFGLAIGSISAFGIVFATSKLVIKIYFYGKMFMDILIIVLSFTTLIELLPYNQRFIAPLVFHMATALGLAINSLFFLRLGVNHYAIYIGITFLVGFVVAYYFTSDSICHLIATRRLEKAEDKIADMELEQVTDSSSKIYRYHEKVAKKVFEDLAYPDRDELKVFDFLRKLFHSQKIRAIIFLIIQSFSCGFIDFETVRMYSERFARPPVLMGDRCIAYSLSFCLLTNRVRAMTTLLGLMLITIAFSRIFLSFDRRNQCGSHLFVEVRFGWFSYCMNIAMGALLYTYQGFIMLHFLEVAPSILRSACTILVYVPMKISFSIGYWLVASNRGLGDFRYPIYLLHFVMLVCQVFRNSTMTPFTLYFVDLIPAEVSIKEVDAEDYNERTPKNYDSPHVKSNRGKKGS